MSACAVGRSDLAVAVRAVGLGLDLARACCDLVGRVAAAPVAAVVAVQPVAADFVPGDQLDLVGRVSAVPAVHAAAAVVAVQPVAVDFVPGDRFDLVGRAFAGPAVHAVAVVVQPVAVDSVPGDRFDLVGRAVLCLGLAAYFVLVVAARIVDPAAFALCFYLAGLVAVRKSERRHQKRAAKPR